MSHIESVVKASKKFENVLDKYFDIKGAGLKDRIFLSEEFLPEELYGNLLWFEDVRSKIVHGDYDDLVDIDISEYEFHQKCREIDEGLQKLYKKKTKKRIHSKKAGALGFFMVIMFILSLVGGFFIKNKIKSFFK